MAKTKSTLRTLDAGADEGKVWNASGAGASADKGVGNKALAALKVSKVSDNDTFKRIESAYKKVVAVVKALDDDDQRSILLSAASDFTLASLREKSKTGKQPGTLSAKEKERFHAILTADGEKAALDYARKIKAGKEAKTDKPMTEQQSKAVDALLKSL